MEEQMKVLVQWSNGSKLPVLTKKTAKISELSKLLKFACSHYEEVQFLYKGNLLDPNTTLESHFIRDNDVIDAFIIQKTSRNQELLNSHIQSVVLEAAKITDRQLNMVENSQITIKPAEEASTDDEERNLYDYYYFKNEKAIEITENPLPIFWSKQEIKLDDIKNEDYNLKERSIEEVGKFLEKKGWSSWLW